MKLYLIEQVAKHWINYKNIDFIKRILDNEILICFDRQHYYQIDLTKSRGYIYKLDKDMLSLEQKKQYKAPFDNILYTRFHSSDIVDIEAFENDRILKITVSKKQSYKNIETSLQLEFTGKNTNAIILDNKNIIVEALRHVDKNLSYREIKPGVALKPLKPYDIKEDKVIIEDIDLFLEQSYKERQEQKINSIRELNLIAIDKRITQVDKIFSSLEREEDIEEITKLWSAKANLILMNPENIDIHSPYIMLEDTKIDIPPAITSVYELSNYCFKKSKKSKAIGENIYLQKENLEQKLLFLKRHRLLIKESNSLDKILFLNSSKKKSNKKVFCEEFSFNGFKILVGRNSNENVKILKSSKKDDLWMHIKDIASSHVVIISKKQQFPLSVIEKAASLCVDMSVSYEGKYRVDYTYRRHVRIKQGSNVLYTNHKSIIVQKETL